MKLKSIVGIVVLAVLLFASSCNVNYRKTIQKSGIEGFDFNVSQKGNNYYKAIVDALGEELDFENAYVIDFRMNVREDYVERISTYLKTIHHIDYNGSQPAILENMYHIIKISPNSLGLRDRNAHAIIETIPETTSIIQPIIKLTELCAAIDKIDFSETVKYLYNNYNEEYDSKGWYSLEYRNRLTSENLNKLVEGMPFGVVENNNIDWYETGTVPILSDGIFYHFLMGFEKGSINILVKS